MTKERTLCIDVRGAAGHGKTTVATLLKDFLRQHFPKSHIVTVNPDGDEPTADRLNRQVETLRAEPLNLVIRERSTPLAGLEQRRG